MRLIDADDLERRIMMMPDDVLCEDCCYNVVNAIDSMPTVSGWISVKDRLPKFVELHEEEVLALFEDGEIASVHYDECIDEGSIFGYWHQYFDERTMGATDSEWRPIDNITHWMPLPEPPKE